MEDTDHTDRGRIDWTDYIHADPKVMVGKPVVRGSRLTAEFILGLFAAGWTHEQVLDSYPGLTPDAIRAVFAFAAETVEDVRFFSTPVPVRAHAAQRG